MQANDKFRRLRVASPRGIAIQSTCKRCGESVTGEMTADLAQKEKLHSEKCSGAEILLFKSGKKRST